MGKSDTITKQLIEDTQKFEHIYKVNNRIVVFSCINDLTAFCFPSIRSINRQIRFDYDYGLAVCKQKAGRIDFILKNIADRNCVMLPETISPDHSLDMMVNGGRLSDWVVNEMLELMKRYCLSSSDAITFINNSNDRLIESLRSVYKETFTSVIVEPLLRE